MTRLMGPREPGLGPSLTHPKRAGVGLIALRWRHELGIAGVVLGGFGIAVAWLGLDHALLGLAGVAAAGGVACCRSEVRRLVAVRFWLIVTPHRVRTCFARAWVYNERGQVPAVLRAASTPYGERVLVWCLAGTSFADIESAADLLAAACFATEVIASRDPRRGHLVYLDVIRWAERDADLGAEPESLGPDAGEAPPRPTRPFGLPGADTRDAA